MDERVGFDNLSQLTGDGRSRLFSRFIPEGGTIVAGADFFGKGAGSNIKILFVSPAVAIMIPVVRGKREDR
jgi:hypothetical protein